MHRDSGSRQCPPASRRSIPCRSPGQTSSDHQTKDCGRCSCSAFAHESTERKHENDFPCAAEGCGHTPASAPSAISAWWWRGLQEHPCRSSSVQARADDRHKRKRAKDHSAHDPQPEHRNGFELADHGPQSVICWLSRLRWKMDSRRTLYPLRTP
jgi:hypothetical protein